MAHVRVNRSDAICSHYFLLFPPRQHSFSMSVWCRCYISSAHFSPMTYRPRQRPPHSAPLADDDALFRRALSFRVEEDDEDDEDDLILPRVKRVGGGVSASVEQKHHDSSSEEGNELGEKGEEKRKCRLWLPFRELSLIDSSPRGEKNG